MLLFPKPPPPVWRGTLSPNLVYPTLRLYVISSTEPPCNIIFRPLVVGGVEHLRSLTILHHFPQKEECRHIAYPKSLLHVVGDNYNCVPILESQKKLFDFFSAYWIQGGSRL